MHITVAHISPLLSLLAGVLILMGCGNVTSVLMADAKGASQLQPAPG